jgi:hypothetical protein
MPRRIVPLEVTHMSEQRADPGAEGLDQALRGALKSQYHAALAMFRDAAMQCPEAEWLDGKHRNAFWQIAYHTLFFTHLYLQPDESTFRPWARHQAHVQQQDGIEGPADPGSILPVVPQPYSREDVLAYWEVCDAMVVDALDALDLHRADSGFYWYPMSKLEHQFVNIRHIQHHAAQLADRVRAAADVGVRWVGQARRQPPATADA